MAKDPLEALPPLPAPTVGFAWQFKGKGYLSKKKVRFAFLGKKDTAWRVDDAGFPGGMEDGVYAAEVPLVLYADMAAVPKVLLQKYLDGVWQCAVPFVCSEQWDTLAWINWINLHGVWKAHNRAGHKELTGKPLIHGMPISAQVEFPTAGVLLVGQSLFTKDGRKIGNAIIARRLEEAAQESYEIETDFGNLCTFTRTEIEDWFWLLDKDGTTRIQSLTDWRTERQLKRITHGQS